MPQPSKKDKVNRKLLLVQNSVAQGLKRKRVIADILQVDKKWKPVLEQEEIDKRVAVVGPAVIHNQVSSFNCSTEINVKKLAKVANGDFDAKKFSARCTLRFDSFSCGVFTNGNVTILGAKGIHHATACAHYICDYIGTKLGIKVEVADFIPSNVQCAINLRRPIDLEALAEALPVATYNPDKINHVSIPMTDSYYDETLKERVVREKLGHFLVYATGKIVLVGLPSVDMVQEVVNDTMSFFVQFTK